MRKALEIFEDQLEKDEHYLGAFDYLHLGVLYFETGQWQKAIDAFQKQEEENNLAENHFYLALVYKELGQSDQYINSSGQKIFIRTGIICLTRIITSWMKYSWKTLKMK